MKNYFRFGCFLVVCLATGWLMLRMALPEKKSTVANSPVRIASWASVTRNARADWLGASGNLRAIIATPQFAKAQPQLMKLLPDEALENSGLYQLNFRTPDGEPLLFFSLVPFREKKSKNFRGYYMGSWPRESNGAVQLPDGFIEVTAENQFTPVSKHFKLRDFLPHDQAEVWPKFMVLNTSLLDKLELIANELEREKKPSRFHIMSGFRTPQYNAEGVGKGRANNSQHIYGNAADIYIDADGDNRMDDLDGDGESTTDDARYLFAIAEKIETQYPELAGGLSVYRATSARGAFVHIDVRGAPVRW